MPVTTGNDRFVSESAVVAKKKATFRPDIQGLRALAVLVVIADHLFGWPLGGFVGVDVFFVISGFLITGILLREHDKTNHISFLGFYRRRIRRIIPVATLVLVVTVVASFALFARGRAESIAVDGLWAFFFSANWHTALVGTDYFQVGLSPSLLQHYWSLSVEEQFYFVWPWMMLGLLALAARLGWRFHAKRLSVIAVFAVVSAASFAWSVHETVTNPTFAYFSTFSRAWELGLGAILAALSIYLMKIPVWLRPILGWLGLLGIAVSLFVITPETAFPGPSALLPVAATAIVIIAGTGPSSRAYNWAMLPLTNRVSTYIGDISYSLYLWHFPVAILLAVFVPELGPIYFAIALAIMAGLSVFSYHLIEVPIRNSAWLEPKATRNHHRRRRFTPVISRSAQYVGFGLIATGALLLMVAALNPKLTVQSAVAANPAATAHSEIMPTPTGEDSMSPQETLGYEIRSAVVAQSWPQLNPTIDQLGGTAWVPEWLVDECLNVDDDKVSSCMYGDPNAEKTAVLLGDSVAISWMPGIRAALETSGWNIQSLTFGQCPAAVVAVVASNASEGFTEACNKHNEWALLKLAEIHPDLVIASSAVSTLGRLASEATGKAALTEWRSGFSDTLGQLQDLGLRTVVLDSPPPGKGLQECYSTVNSPSSCLSEPSEVYKGMAAATEAVAAKYGAKFVKTLSWVCGPWGTCPAFVAGIPTFADGIHFTAKYSEHLAPVLAEALLEAE